MKEPEQVDDVVELTTKGEDIVVLINTKCMLMRLQLDPKKLAVTDLAYSLNNIGGN